MAGKRRELFSAVQDKQGDLEIHFPDSKIAIDPSEDFWEAVIDEIEFYLENDDELTEEGEDNLKEVRDIIQDYISDTDYLDS